MDLESQHFFLSVRSYIEHFYVYMQFIPCRDGNDYRYIFKWSENKKQKIKLKIFVCSATASRL